MYVFVIFIENYFYFFCIEKNSIKNYCIIVLNDFCYFLKFVYNYLKII